MPHAISLGLFCIVVWVLLSFHFDALLLGLGVVSCALVVLVAWRMNVVDSEGQPLHLSRGLVGYLPWLVWQIIKANLAVMACIMNPRLPISPTVVSLTPGQRTDLGRVIYANSITLTPGTVTLGVDRDSLEVHALTRAGARTLARGEMNRRVARLERRH